MPEETLSALEFPELIQVMEQYAVSALGRACLRALRPLTALPEIRARFQEIQELRELEYREGPLPLSDFPDLAPWIHKAAVRGSLLPPEAFNDILIVLKMAAQVRHWLGLGGESVPHLALLARDLNDLPALKDAIRQSISPHNFILDEASPELAAVRRDLGETRERLNRQIRQTFFGAAFQDALQSPTISQRHGRYVIPIKADHKGAIPGIIHDQSQTRATLYLEPLAIVEHNNALNLLANREKREEEAVLRRLTDLVRAGDEALKRTQAALAAVDAVSARVRFAQAFRAREPIFHSRGGLDFRQARHPLLMARRREDRSAPEVVPVDLRLTDQARWLIISGANAGGKTVALKTLGLLTLMAQSGIPIPVDEGSEFSPFAAVYADIGDPQDLHQDLSTFSAHQKRALRMLAAPPGRALILLDELGTATDPTEGGALALALLRAFYGRGAFGAATTHLPLLKGFAQRTEGFENVAVVFDEETRRPTYRLAYGVVGASNALKIARELGLSADILAEAEGFLDQDELKAYRLLAEVEAAQQDLTRREAELGQRREELQGERQELEAARRELDQEKRRLAGEVKQAALAQIRRAEDDFKAIVRRLRGGGESWGRLRQEFSERQAKLLEELTPGPALATPAAAPQYREGDKVFLPALGLTGEVAEVQDGRLEVRVRKVKLRVSAEEVAPAAVGAKARRGGVAISYHPAPESLPTLNVVGLRVDEALPLVDRLIDQAMLHGAERVDIIHGVGTGRLKKAVWDHLKHHTQVKAVHGDDNPGVTVVDLKE